MDDYECFKLLYESDLRTTKPQTFTKYNGNIEIFKPYAQRFGIYNSKLDISNCTILIFMNLSICKMFLHDVFARITKFREYKIFNSQICSLRTV